MSENDDVETFLNKWYELKETIANLEKTMDTYKTMAEKMMVKRKTNVLINTNFILRKRELSRASVSKKDLPETIWNQYSKNSNYNAYFINKIQPDKKKKI
jgi:hypothetical protein